MTERRPIATVDLAIFALAPEGLDVLLMRRALPPFAGALALPGGFVHVEEDADLEAAARRVLKSKTAVETPYLEQIATVGDAARDPRGWSLSVAYMALVAAPLPEARPGITAADVAWHPVSGITEGLVLAFDHTALLQLALGRLRAKVEYTTLPVHLLPDTFTLSELQAVYERVLGRPLDKSAFRKRMAEAAAVEPVPGALRRGSNRPAQLYRARPTVYFDRTL